MRRSRAALNYQCVEVLRIKHQGVIIIFQAVDFNVQQAHLIVGEDGIWIQQVAHN